MQNLKVISGWKAFPEKICQTKVFPPNRGIHKKIYTIPFLKMDFRSVWTTSGGNRKLVMWTKCGIFPTDSSNFFAFPRKVASLYFRRGGWVEVTYHLFNFYLGCQVIEHKYTVSLQLLMNSRKLLLKSRVFVKPIFHATGKTREQNALNCPESQISQRRAENSIGRQMAFYFSARKSIKGKRSDLAKTDFVVRLYINYVVLSYFFC